MTLSNIINVGNKPKDKFTNAWSILYFMIGFTLVSFCRFIGINTFSTSITVLVFNLVSNVKRYQVNKKTQYCNEINNSGSEFYDTLGVLFALAYFNESRTPTTSQMIIIIGLLFGTMFLLRNLESKNII